MELSFWQRMFPQRALQREIVKAKITAIQKAGEKRYYDAGQQSPYRPKNLGFGPDVSPQGITQDGAQPMRQYIRNLDENHALTISILDTLVNGVIGTGIPMMPLVKNSDGSLNTQANEQITRILAEWSKAPTADRGQSFAHAQRQLCRSWLRDGEVIIQTLRGNMPNFDHRGPIPYTIELMEADYLPYQLNTTSPRLIVQGVQITPYYEPIAYYLSKIHPGDIWNSAAGGWSSEVDYNRVEADKILHLKFTRRINQVRGVSLLHGVIRTLEDINGYTESEQIAARVASAFTGFIKKSPDVATNINADTGNRDLEMAPGMIFDSLLPGEEIGTLSSNRPNTEINNFTAGLMRQVAAGTMTSYSTVTRDYEGSYSSQRQALVESKPNYDVLRDYFVNQFITPVYRDLIDLAITSGALTVPRSVKRETLYDMKAPDVTTPWIDPKKEVEADVLRINNGLASRSQVITERGGDPLQVVRQIENDQKLFPEVKTNDVATQTGQSDESEATADSEDTETQE